MKRTCFPVQRKRHTNVLKALAHLQIDLDLPAEIYSDAVNLVDWMASFEYILYDVNGEVAFFVGQRQEKLFI